MLLHFLFLNGFIVLWQRKLLLLLFKPLSPRLWLCLVPGRGRWGPGGVASQWCQTWEVHIHKVSPESFPGSPCPCQRASTTGCPVLLNPLSFCSCCCSGTRARTLLLFQRHEPRPFPRVTLTGHDLVALNSQKASPVGCVGVLLQSPLPQILHGSCLSALGFQAFKLGHDSISIISSRSAPNAAAETSLVRGLYSFPAIMTILAFLSHFSGFLLV